MKWGLNFAHATTAQLLWHDQNFAQILWLFFKEILITSLQPLCEMRSPWLGVSLVNTTSIKFLLLQYATNLLKQISLTHWGWDKIDAILQKTFKCNFLNENVWIPIKISLKFVPKGPINNIPALVQIMAWCHPGDKPLSRPMIVRLPTHICVTQRQWVKHMIFQWVGHMNMSPCTGNRTITICKHIALWVGAWI